MNVQKLTQKSIEAVQAAHSLAVEHSNAEVRLSTCWQPFWNSRTG